MSNKGKIHIENGIISSSSYITGSIHEKGSLKNRRMAGFQAFHAWNDITDGGGAFQLEMTVATIKTVLFSTVPVDAGQCWTAPDTFTVPSDGMYLLGASYAVSMLGPKPTNTEWDYQSDPLDFNVWFSINGGEGRLGEFVKKFTTGTLAGDEDFASTFLEQSWGRTLKLYTLHAGDTVNLCIVHKADGIVLALEQSEIAPATYPYGQPGRTSMSIVKVTDYTEPTGFIY